MNKNSSDIDGLTVGLQFADTTWRVAIPILGLCFIGIKLDKHYHSAPLFVLIGLFISIILATVLVYKQLKSAYPDFFNFKKDRK